MVAVYASMRTGDNGALWASLGEAAPVVVPSAPTGVSAFPTGGTTAQFALTDTNLGIAQYRWQIRPVGGTFADAVGSANPSAPGVATFNATGGTPAGEFEIRTRAESPGGESAWTQAASSFFFDNSAGGTVVIGSTDSTAPILTGSIVITALTTVSYTATCPPASDAVGVTGYQWRLGGSGSWTDIAAGGRTANFSGRTPASTDTLEMRARDAAGNFSNPLSTAVTLLGIAPTVTLQPTNASVVDGAVATFTVAFSGTPTPTRQWYRNGAVISGATGLTYSLTTSIADTGSVFVCRATNSAGFIDSSAAVLTVTAAAVAPSIVTQPASQTVAPAAPVTFSVVAGGSSPLSYQWRRNGVAISGATSASYTFTPAGTDNGALYSVVVTNAAGTITSSSAAATITSTVVGASDPTISINRGEWDLFAYRMRKQPRETRDVVIEMANWFAGRADSPASVSFDVSDPALAATVSLIGTRIYITAGAGVDGAQYRITVLLSTTSVPAIVREFDLFVQVTEVQ